MEPAGAPDRAACVTPPPSLGQFIPAWPLRWRHSATSEGTLCCLKSHTGCQTGAEGGRPNFRYMSRAIGDPIDTMGRRCIRQVWRQAEFQADSLICRITSERPTELWAPGQGPPGIFTTQNSFRFALKCRVFDLKRSADFAPECTRSELVGR